MDVKTVVVVVSAFVGALAWLFNLQSRVGAHEAGCIERQKAVTDSLQQLREGQRETHEMIRLAMRPER